MNALKFSIRQLLKNPCFTAVNVVILAIFALPATTQAQTGAGRTLTPTERAAVIDALVARLDTYYVFPAVAKKMGEAIRARRNGKEYDNISDGPELAALLTRHLREVSHDGHLGIEFSTAPAPEEEAEEGPTPEEIERFNENAARANYEFKKVERLDGAVGYLDLGGFYPAEMMGDTAAGAMSFLSNSEAIIIDLRHNSGGAPTGVLLLASYFFERETHWTDQHDRAKDTTRQYWTLPVVPGKRLADKDLYVLTSRHTISAPEDFAYNMQALKRATIVGETTGGGAHGTMPRRLTERFTANIPFSTSINPITKTDWESVGVKPDVAAPADQALIKAHLLALEKSIKRHADNPALVADLTRIITDRKRDLEKLSIQKSQPAGSR